MLDRAAYAPDLAMPLFEKGQVSIRVIRSSPARRKPICLPWEYRDTNGDGLPQLSEYHF